MSNWILVLMLLFFGALAIVEIIGTLFPHVSYKRRWTLVLDINAAIFSIWMAFRVGGRY